MTSITLTEILGEPRSWSPKDHPERVFHSYRVKAEDGTVFEINRKATSGPPELGPGEYEITPAKGDFPPKLSRVFQGGGGRGRSPEQDAYWQAKTERDIVSQRRQGRAHAQEMGIRVAVAAGYFKGEVTRIKLDEDLLPLIDWFDQDTLSKGNDAGLGGGMGGGSVPPVSPPAAESSAASPARKGQTSRRLREAGIADPDTQKAIVHAFAGDPVSVAGLDAVDAAVANRDWHVVFDEHGIPRPPDFPDTADLPPLEVA